MNTKKYIAFVFFALSILNGYSQKTLDSINNISHNNFYEVFQKNVQKEFSKIDFGKKNYTALYSFRIIIKDKNNFEIQGNAYTPSKISIAAKQALSLTIDSLFTLDLSKSFIDECLIVPVIVMYKPDSAKNLNETISYDQINGLFDFEVENKGQSFSCNYIFKPISYLYPHKNNWGKFKKYYKQQK